MKITNYYVDQDGRTYRVALSDGGHPLAVFRRHLSHDHGQAILASGALGKRLVAKARAQQEAGRP